MSEEPATSTPFFDMKIKAVIIFAIYAALNISSVFIFDLMAWFVLWCGVLPLIMIFASWFVAYEERENLKDWKLFIICSLAAYGGMAYFSFTTITSSGLA